MSKIKHEPRAVPHAVSTSDGILADILNELRAIHDHLDAREEQEEQPAPKEHKRTATTDAPPPASKPAANAPAPKRARSHA